MVSAARNVDVRKAVARYSVIDLPAGRRLFLQGSQHPAARPFSSLITPSPRRVQRGLVAEFTGNLLTVRYNFFARAKGEPRIQGPKLRS